MTRWARRILVVCAIGWVLLVAVRCHLPRQTVSPTADSTSAIYLVRHGWHAGIAISTDDVGERWPVVDSFSTADYLEVGWGEARYYPARDPGLGTLLRAGFWPTASVLHVVPVSHSVQSTFPHNTIVRIPVSSAELDAVVRFISASFATDADGAPVDVASGYYVGSRFYRARLPYHGLNNCNHWAAAALEAAGCEVRPRWTFTVGQVLRRAEECGVRLR